MPYTESEVWSKYNQNDQDYIEVNIIQYMLEINILSKEILHKIVWVSWRVIFKGLDVQMTPKRPAGWGYDYDQVNVI